MACRQVLGLKFAEALGERPKGIPNGKPRLASKLYGLRFERAVAERTQGIHGQWFRFVDLNGEGFCQPDVIMIFGGEAIVLECKLTEVGEARAQLGGLYIPVVAMALKKPTKGIVVARHLTKETERQNVCASMGLALKAASASYYPTLHWIGRGPI